MEYTLETFIDQEYPHLKYQFELWKICQTNHQSLVGKTCVAIRAGFSCGNEGGTKMIIEKIECFTNPHSKITYSDLIVTFIPHESSKNQGSSWGTNLNELHKSVKIIE